MASGSTQVKYLAIYQKIKQQILDGEYKINEKIPSSPILAEKFGVASLTIKKALDLLVRDGYIIRRRGSGTVVQDWHQQEKARMIQTLIGTKAVYGSEVESKIIEFAIIGADETMARKLGIAAGDFIYKIIRLRIIHGIPTIMEHTWMPISVIPGVDVTVLEQSIYSHIQNKLGLQVGTSIVRVKGIRPDDREKQFLDVTDQDYLMRVEQVAYLTDGRTFEYSYADHLPETFEFETVITAKNYKES
ncbi:GntR family transcriptional regulator [Paenibacillus alvei]|uniref:GntR family transcriptional regulator n=1 Tax=Paenibacillus alvei TaxID=44250 RepID=A0ABT4GWD4_PAEAL|nr:MULTISPECIES: GntR family transcriptional regulator [Paenibacillus]EJW19992.1 transcriptional regulator, GntR family [Paenibacillus alvei DSM 29]MCY7485736.1 GntR family transcriptional regulator [Paenibacillus alvei]MCY9544796.1 GntR family transcriptional regulator [Paenibacillus alvei]MCY9707592.1 GntR family transcriptional regulator [Paenibacillus alvei]MCY9733747.1 GntR family transcriptional regulator [Paenibacillus alvei]